MTSTKPIYVILICTIVGTLLISDSITPAKKEMFLTYFLLLSGVAIFFGFVATFMGLQYGDLPQHYQDGELDSQQVGLLLGPRMIASAILAFIIIFVLLCMVRKYNGKPTIPSKKEIHTTLSEIFNEQTNRKHERMPRGR